MATAKKAPAKKSATKKTATEKAAKKVSAKAAVKSASPKTAVKKAAAKKAVPYADAGDQIDTQLARYRSMRNFGVTAEPSGGSKSSKLKSDAFPFVIQKHAASHLHYDFRLGWNGVLKSWAVAKGPSYFTGDRRLAVQVEDHPMEYGGFEGIIPKGQYGGGTVMVWDQGTWEPHVDVDEGLSKGTLKFAMNGTKMKGNWTLVRMNNMSGNKPNWLLIKEHDEFERTKDDPCVTAEEPNSVVTGRSLEQIAAAETHVWQSNRTKNAGQAWFRNDDTQVGSDQTEAPETEAVVKAAPKEDKKKASEKVIDLKAKLAPLPKEKLPDFIAPQLASHADTPPEHGDWLHELKLDGYRIQARKQGDKIQLLTRTGLDWTHRMKPVAEALRSLKAKDALVDGEVVVLDESGISSFAKLQASFEQGEKHPMTYFVFDLLHLDAADTRKLPLRERKSLLTAILPSSTEIQMSEHLHLDGGSVFQHACELHAEGIISKRADAPYTPGRNASWVKSKCVREQEFVIGGFTLPSNDTYGIGSLLLGYYRDGKLIYAGRTGTGFTQKIHRMLRDKLEGLRTKSVTFDQIPAVAKRDANWVKPELLAQVRFATWTADDLVRQASYLGLREDKLAADVRREEATVAPKPRSARVSVKVPSASIAAKVAPAKAKKAKSEDAPRTTVPVRLTHPEKILDETTGITKLQLAEYYWAIAEHMLPHIEDRPLSLVRCPEGSGKPCFFQKHTNHMLPPGIGSVMVPNKKTGEPESYITLNTAEALAGLAQMGVLEVHPWGSKNSDLEHPDRIIIDLDPDEAITWKQLSDSAESVRNGLETIGLKSFLKTTGGKGLHVVIPMTPNHDWTQVKAWSHAFAQAFEKEQPDLYLTKMTKSARKGKIYIDYLRNERGATAVAPFSPRARPGATVSVPLAWKELASPKHPAFSIQDFENWKARLKSDPWKNMQGIKQTLPGLS
ncbi:DNA ligase D [Terriglobus saanensis]|nr:DNA ligase D [Terriglobus saanensis]